MKRIAVLWTVLLVWTAAGAAPVPKRTKTPDAYPPDVVARLQSQAAAEASALPKLAPAGEQYLINKDRWAAGSRVLVAFNGGTPEMHRAIARVASQWVSKANLTLDFGLDPATGRYREWRTTDTVNTAHIRVGFAQSGYWSAVGKDALNPRTYGPGTASMNLEGFIEEWPLGKPYLWESTVLHEFGHALGFRHEHQRQVCAKQLRWTDGPDPATQPSIYTVMRIDQGWSATLVDNNLAPLANPEAVELKTEEPDKASTMFYAIPPRAFLKGAQSTCYLPLPNSKLSAADLRGVALAFPHTVYGNPADSTPRPRLHELIDKARVALTPAEKSAVTARSEALEAAARPLLYIHIQRESDRALAKKLQATSKEAGFFAPGIENVSRTGARSGKVAQVRYFRPIDADAANSTVAMVKSLTGGEVQLLEVRKYSKSVTRNLVEVWFP